MKFPEKKQRKLFLSVVAVIAATSNVALADSDKKKPEQAHTAATAEVLVTWGQGLKLDRLDYEAALQQNVKKEHRSEFARDMRRITGVLDDVHVRRVLSERAIKEGLDQDPVIARQMVLARERLLSSRWLERWEAALVVPDMTAAAEEQYKLKPDAYSLPEQVHASHVLIGLDKRSDEEGRARAEEVLAKARAGEDFKALVKEYSDDPSASRNGGDLGWFARDKMVKPFSDAAFALEKKGDISDVVKSNFGYHVILLHEKKPPSQKTFDVVKGKIISELEKKWRDEQRAAYLSEIRNDKSILLNAPAIDALLVK